MCLMHQTAFSLPVELILMKGVQEEDGHWHSVPDIYPNRVEYPGKNERRKFEDSFAASTFLS